MNLLQQFKQHFSKNVHTKLAVNNQFIVAVSGGVDSVVLVDLMAKIGVNFVIAHCNFKLRGNESDNDEDFVKQLANNYEKQVFVTHFNTATFATENKISIQLAARQLRYNWFAQLQNQTTQTTNYLTTAHHCNDNIETVLMNFFRGTGIDGLTGIENFDKKRKIIRPLLPFKKEILVQYANDNNLNFVEDASNATNKYTRNNFRNQIIPLIATHFVAAEDNILSNIGRMNDVQELYLQAIEKHKTNLLEYRGDEIHISILKLKKSSPLTTIVWEIIKPFSFTANQIPEVLKLLVAHNGSYIQSERYRIINNRNWLIITPLKDNISQNIIIEKETKKEVFDAGVLTFSQLPFGFEQYNELHQSSNKQSLANEIAMVDLSAIEFPLLLRKCKQGDYFYPLGMTKKQKLSKFFINQKLSKIDKENVWVIESNKKIVWVVGYRIDNRCKIANTTTTALKISYFK